MRGITNSNVVNSVQDTLEALETSCGLEVSDNPNYRTSVSWTSISETDIICFAIDFPREVIGSSPESGKLIVKSFNEDGNDYELHLVSSAYGRGITYEGIADYPYHRQLLMVRINEKEG